MLIGGVYLCGCFVMKALNLLHRLVGYKYYFDPNLLITALYMHISFLLGFKFFFFLGGGDHSFLLKKVCFCFSFSSLS